MTSRIPLIKYYISHHLLFDNVVFHAKFDGPTENALLN